MTHDLRRGEFSTLENNCFKSTKTRKFYIGYSMLLVTSFFM